MPAFLGDPVPLYTRGPFVWHSADFESLLLEEKVVAERPDEVEKRTQGSNKIPVEKKGDAKSRLPCVKGGAERSEAEGLA